MHYILKEKLLESISKIEETKNPIEDTKEEKEIKEEVEEKYKLLREQFNNKRLEIERMTGTGGGDHISRRE